jgi:CheY-like chemotaxis protein
MRERNSPIVASVIIAIAATSLRVFPRCTFQSVQRLSASQMSGKAILYAEDDPNDVAILKRALSRASLRHSFYTVHDGQEAIDWLSGDGDYKNRTLYPFPDLLILDLKMPRKTGFDVLEWMRSKPQVESLGVLVLSSSDEPADVRRALSLGATKYFVKSASNKEIIDFLSSPFLKD